MSLLVATGTERL